MSEDETRDFRDERKMVTHALAELEVYFEHAKLADGRPMWRISFRLDEETDPVEVRIGFLREWVVFQSLPMLGTGIESERLIRAQSSVAVARIVVADGSALVAQAEISITEIRPGNVARALDGVVNLVVQLRGQPNTH